jgi:hypothetical protein
VPIKVDWPIECVLVWSTLERIQGTGYVPQAVLAAACGRKPRRIERVIAEIRDALPDCPLVSGKDGYRITGDPVENEAYRLLVTSTVHTRFRRWLTGSAEPYFRDLAVDDPVEADRLRLQATQMLQTLELSVRSHFRRRNGGNGTVPPSPTP